MKIEKKQEDEIGFQLAPMIDMTFLLLIFFMVTTKISKDQVKVDIKLPTAANATIPNDLSNRDIISIDGTGQYYIGQVPASKKELTTHLKERFKVTPPSASMSAPIKAPPASKSRNSCASPAKPAP